MIVILIVGCAIFVCFVVLAARTMRGSFSKKQGQIQGC
jgi:hypothetical protein